jgi:hypothetical protein
MISDSFGDGIGVTGGLTVIVDGIIVESSFTGREKKRVMGCAACASDEYNVSINIITDDELYSETEWSISNSLTNELLQKGDDYMKTSTYRTEFCQSVECMTFTISKIFDYTLTVEGEIIASGNNILDAPETTAFGCPPTVSPKPSATPSSNPSFVPSMTPSILPTASFHPSTLPSGTPSALPSVMLTSIPSALPSEQPSLSMHPSYFPSTKPSANPSSNPSITPTLCLRGLE